jgi:hypothetical protein
MTDHRITEVVTEYKTPQKKKRIKASTGKEYGKVNQKCDRLFTLTCQDNYHVTGY